jgi:hypothetical protein
MAVSSPSGRTSGESPAVMIRLFHRADGNSRAAVLFEKFVSPTNTGLTNPVE